MNQKSVIEGKTWQARNWSADAAGSIHDDATASKLGFRGGTVAGSIHMDQFVPVMLDIFGPDWFEAGALSLYFINATIDGETVQVKAEVPEHNATQVRGWMDKDDGTPVMAGTASMGDHSQTELKTRDLRACDPAELRILEQLEVGMSLTDEEHHLSSDKLFERLDQQLVSDPIDWYRGDSPWNGAVASPSAMVELLWGVPTKALRGNIGNSVGLFGAIEVAQVHGPLLLDQTYRVTSEVIAVGQSPKTEVLWFDSSALDGSGNLIATHRMMLRFMKASSELYQD